MRKLSNTNNAAVQKNPKTSNCLSRGKMSQAVWKHTRHSPTQTGTYSQSSHIFHFTINPQNKTHNIPIHSAITHKAFGWSRVGGKRYVPTVPGTVSWISVNRSLKLRSLWESILHLSNLAGLEEGNRAGNECHATRCRRHSCIRDSTEK